jgi:hypothetical protein
MFNEKHNVMGYFPILLKKTSYYFILLENVKPSNLCLMDVGIKFAIRGRKI